jgi:flagella basal body P-ring formation protein FlgA
MSGKSIILAVVLLGLGLAASSDAQARPRRGHVTVERDRIALRDVSPTAPVELLALDIAPAPAPGGKTVISRTAIKVALERAGADPRLADALPASQIVQRAALTVEATELEAIVRERLAEQLPLGVNVDAVRGLTKATLPVGQLDVRVRPGRLRQSTTVSVTLRVDDRIVARQNGVASLSGEARTPTLRNDLPRGSVVGAGDVAYETSAIEDLPGRVLTRTDSLVGKRLTQPGKAGRPVQSSAVEAPPAIERGAKVRLVAAMKGVTMSRLVVAQEDGRIGDTIRVRTDDRRDTLDAKVVSASEVRVPMGVSQ